MFLPVSEAQQWFTSCAEPSVFTLLKSLTQSAYLLESVLDLASCCEGVFLLLSSTTVVFRGLPGVLVLLSSPVCSFFLRMKQTADLSTADVSALSLMGLF